MNVDWHRSFAAVLACLVGGCTAANPDFEAGAGSGTGPPQGTDSEPADTGRQLDVPAVGTTGGGGADGWCPRELLRAVSDCMYYVENPALEAVGKGAGLTPYRADLLPPCIFGEGPDLRLNELFPPGEPAIVYYEEVMCAGKAVPDDWCALSTEQHQESLQQCAIEIEANLPLVTWTKAPQLPLVIEWCPEDTCAVQADVYDYTYAESPTIMGDIARQLSGELDMEFTMPISARGWPIDLEPVDTLAQGLAEGTEIEMELKDRAQISADLRNCVGTEALTIYRDPVQLRVLAIYQIECNP